MIDLPSQRDPVELLAEEFAARLRQGEIPSVSEYAQKHPAHAERIEALFPAVAMMERMRAEEKSRREAAPRPPRRCPAPEQIGDFEILREIGRGGMGIVYEAEQTSLGRQVAVKVLPKHVLLADEHLKRFQREAQTAARLQHPNIVPVFGAGEQDGLYYYVMPLVRGVGLDEIIRRLQSGNPSTEDVSAVVRSLIAAKFPTEPPAAAAARPGRGEERWRAAAHVALQAAEALSYAHAQGTLHRDVKPGNLLVDEDGVVLVADFGLARAVDHADASRSGDCVGTLRYMAPEQWQGGADCRSDVYGLGLTLYELLTLRPAFGDSDPRRRLPGEPTAAEPVPPVKIDPAIPRDLETIVLTCLAAEPSQRYQTAAALAADLRRLLDDRPISARRVRAVERAWRWCRRNRALAAVSAAAAVLLVAAAATAITAHVHTTRAHAGATAALARAEATSQLALDVLDDVYLQLSPDRVRLAFNADPANGACSSIGLSAGTGSPRGTPGRTWQVQASRETAALLNDLLVFYDRLAEQGGDDWQVRLESAIACRRLGDIRQRLGQLDHAERDYARAAEKLAALAAGADSARTTLLHTELARTHNEIGNVRSARFEHGSAYESHCEALGLLQSLGPSETLPEPYRFELARTLYFLGSKQLGAAASRYEHGPLEEATGPGPPSHKSNECRRQAVSILEALAAKNPEMPDCRFLLALCCRPSAFGPDPDWTSSGAEGRRQAIAILEELRSQHPDVVDYRYELAASYAWVHVGLFPWQRPSTVPATAEESLLKALAESQWLADHNPAVPDYARSQTLILAKLGTVCWRAGRLAEAEDFFRRALATQAALVTAAPDLPSHHRVLLEFIRLRLAQVALAGGSLRQGACVLGECSGLLDACITNLTELTGTPELADDRLAWHSLSLAYSSMGKVLDAMGEHEQSENMKQQALSTRSRMADLRTDCWP